MWGRWGGEQEKKCFITFQWHNLCQKSFITFQWHTVIYVDVTSPIGDCDVSLIASWIVTSSTLFCRSVPPSVKKSGPHPVTHPNTFSVVHLLGYSVRSSYGGSTSKAMVTGERRKRYLFDVRTTEIEVHQFPVRPNTSPILFECRLTSISGGRLCLLQ